MTRNPTEALLKAHLAKQTKTQASDWFLVLKARYGLEVVLTAIADWRGRGEVITQPFTCITAVNPIMSAGHRPVYVDLAPDTLSLDPASLHATTASRAVIAQHSFGIPTDLRAIRAFADAHDLLLIEDSAHKPGLMATSNQQALADVSVHSFGVEKMLPTKFGAAVWVNPDLKDKQLLAMLRDALASLPLPSRIRSLRIRAYSPTNRLLNHLPSTLKPSLIRGALAHLQLFEPAIAPVERRGKNAGRPTRPTRWVVRRILDEINVFDANLVRRQAAGQLYMDAFRKHDDFTVLTGVVPDGVYTRFPVICRTAEQASALFALLAHHKLNPGKWYRPTLFPGPTDSALYYYDPVSCPVAEDISARIINLPTNISTERVKEIIHACHR